MPRSAGQYSLPSVYLATPGTTIEAAQHNVPLEDIAVALTGSLPRDGTAPMTGNINMNGRRVTGIALPVSDFDAARKVDLPGAASETEAGKVELATTAEALAGSDTTRAVTPAGVKAAIDAAIANLTGDGATVTNWNNVTGSKAVIGNNASNAPAAGATFAGWTSQEGTNSMVVLVVRMGANEVWIRRKVAGTWQAWSQVNP